MAANKIIKGLHVLWSKGDMDFYGITIENLDWTPQSSYRKTWGMNTCSIVNTSIPDLMYFLGITEAEVVQLKEDAAYLSADNV